MDIASQPPSPGRALGRTGAGRGQPHRAVGQLRLLRRDLAAGATGPAPARARSGPTSQMGTWPTWAQARQDLAAVLAQSTLSRLDTAAELAAVDRPVRTVPHRPQHPLLVLRLLITAGQTDPLTLTAGILIGPVRLGWCRPYRIRWCCGPEVTTLLTEVLNIEQRSLIDDADVARMVAAAAELLDRGLRLAVVAVAWADLLAATLTGNDPTIDRTLRPITNHAGPRAQRP